MSREPDLVVGVDAGNSKTVAVVASPAGQLLGWARSGIGDVYGTANPSTAVLAVRRAVELALSHAKADLTDLGAGAFHLAGLDWPEDHELWTHALDGWLPEQVTRIVRNDGFAPLYLAAADGVGVGVIVGTGSAVAARGPDGREDALAFWMQHPAGGAGLGEAALRAVVLADLDLGPATKLTEALVELYGAAGVSELLHAFTRRERPLDRISASRAARAVLGAASGGDEVARAIVEDQVRALAGYARVAACRVGLDPDGDVLVVLAGSVLAGGSGYYRARFERALRLRLPAASTACPGQPPVLGAVMEALVLAGQGPVAEGVRARVLTGFLPVELVVT